MKELQDIEDNNGTAIILAHVPNLDECLFQYGRRFHAIVDRYQHIIRWGMYSHIHQEQYQVVRSIAGNKPIGVNYIIGSVTTYTGKPNSFNVMYLDPDTLLPVDFETHAFDLDYANANDKPKWYMKYNWRERYNMEDLSPESFMKVSQQIYYNDTVAMLYKNHRYIGGPGVNTTALVEDEGLRQAFYCQTISGDLANYEYCLDKDKNSPQPQGVMDGINSHWYEPVKSSTEQIKKMF